MTENSPPHVIEAAGGRVPKTIGSRKHILPLEFPLATATVTITEPQDLTADPVKRATLPQLQSTFTQALHGSVSPAVPRLKLPKESATYTTQDTPTSLLRADVSFMQESGATVLAQQTTLEDWMLATGKTPGPGIDQLERLWEHIAARSSQPSGRAEVIQLGKMLDTLFAEVRVPPPNDQMLPEQLKYIKESYTREFQIWDLGFSEISRQVHVHCMERGLLLERLRERYIDMMQRRTNLYESSMREREDEIFRLQQVIQEIEFGKDNWKAQQAEQQRKVEDLEEKLKAAKEAKKNSVQTLREYVAELEKKLKKPDSAEKTTMVDYQDFEEEDDDEPVSAPLKPNMDSRASVISLAGGFGPVMVYVDHEKKLRNALRTAQDALDSVQKVQGTICGQLRELVEQAKIDINGKPIDNALSRGIFDTFSAFAIPTSVLVEDVAMGKRVGPRGLQNRRAVFFDRAASYAELQRTGMDQMQSIGMSDVNFDSRTGSSAVTRQNSLEDLGAASGESLNAGEMDAPTDPIILSNSDRLKQTMLERLTKVSMEFAMSKSNFPPLVQHRQQELQDVDEACDGVLERIVAVNENCIETVPMVVRPVEDAIRTLVGFVQEINQRMNEERRTMVTKEHEFQTAQIELEEAKQRLEKQFNLVTQSREDTVKRKLQIADLSTKNAAMQAQISNMTSEIAAIKEAKLSVEKRHMAANSEIGLLTNRLIDKEREMNRIRELLEKSEAGQQLIASELILQKQAAMRSNESYISRRSSHVEGSLAADEEMEEYYEEVDEDYPGEAVPPASITDSLSPVNKFRPIKPGRKLVKMQRPRRLPTRGSTHSLTGEGAGSDVNTPNAPFSLSTSSSSHNSPPPAPPVNIDSGTFTFSSGARTQTSRLMLDNPTGAKPIDYLAEIDAEGSAGLSSRELAQKVADMNRDLYLKEMILERERQEARKWRMKSDALADSLKTVQSEVDSLQRQLSEAVAEIMEAKTRPTSPVENATPSHSITQFPTLGNQLTPAHSDKDHHTSNPSEIAAYSRIDNFLATQGVEPTPRKEASAKHHHKPVVEDTSSPLIASTSADQIKPSQSNGSLSAVPIAPPAPSTTPAAPRPRQKQPKLPVDEFRRVAAPDPVESVSPPEKQTSSRRQSVAVGHIVKSSSKMNLRRGSTAEAVKEKPQRWNVGVQCAPKMESTAQQFRVPRQTHSNKGILFDRLTNGDSEPVRMVADVNMRRHIRSAPPRLNRRERFVVRAMLADAETWLDFSDYRTASTQCDLLTDFIPANQTGRRSAQAVPIMELPRTIVVDGPDGPISINPDSDIAVGGLSPVLGPDGRGSRHSITGPPALTLSIPVRGRSRASSNASVSSSKILPTTTPGVLIGDPAAVGYGSAGGMRQQDGIINLVFVITAGPPAPVAPVRNRGFSQDPVIPPVSVPGPFVHASAARLTQVETYGNTLHPSDSHHRLSVSDTEMSVALSRMQGHSQISLAALASLPVARPRRNTHHSIEDGTQSDRGAARGGGKITFSRAPVFGDPGRQYNQEFRVHNKKLAEVAQKHSHLPPRSLRWTRKLIRDVYFKKNAADFVDDREHLEHASFPEFLFEYLKERYGTKQLIYTACGIIVSSLRQYRATDVICDSFARFLDESWGLPILDAYLQAFMMVEARKLSAKIWKDQAGPNCEFEMCADMVRRTKNKMPPALMSDLIEAARSTAEPLAPTVESGAGRGVARGSAMVKREARTLVMSTVSFGSARLNDSSVAAAKEAILTGGPSQQATSAGWIDWHQFMYNFCITYADVVADDDLEEIEHEEKEDQYDTSVF